MSLPDRRVVKTRKDDLSVTLHTFGGVLLMSSMFDVLHTSPGQKASGHSIDSSRRVSVNGVVNGAFLLHRPRFRGLPTLTAAPHALNINSGVALGLRFNALDGTVVVPHGAQDDRSGMVSQIRLERVLNGFPTSRDSESGEFPPPHALDLHDGLGAT